MKQHLCTIVATALLAVTLGSSNAFAIADDTKNYPGAFCQPANATYAANAFYNPAFGTLGNNSTSSDLFIACPIINDEFDGVNSGGSRIAVIDRRIDRSVSCVVRSVRANAGQEVALLVTTSVTSGRAFADSNTKHLTLNAGLSNPGDNGYYTMDCLVPPKVGDAISQIVFYRINED